ncbi:MAG: hypothetical protein Q7U33_03915 [Methylotenera sp.]|uniref:hypothetical protein n=1 Tax=Methylotenera sp. TaxID=2051956 RepID=UPI002723D901|nr:hypothetical protein [Methylotenera sp.]MDO9150504.1 hypothetical protein [Methylotenera sp.]
MLKNGLSFVVIQRLWQGFAGLLTVLVIGLTLTQEQQGWYYTFLSIAALYSVFEMGLTTALIQVTAHMFVKLRWLSKGRVTGDVSAVFRSFFSQAVKVYAFFSLVFLLISFVVGFNVFNHKTTQGVQVIWILPWCFLVVFTAINMLTLPFLAVVEGSGEIAEVYKVKLFQGVLGAIGCWVVLSLGGWLWATIVMPLCGVLVTVTWLLRNRIYLLRGLVSSNIDASFNWRHDVLPLQWRVGLNWISVFLMSQLATPILFYYQDPVVAGQMGLSLTIANMISIVAQSWIAHRVPILSQAVARKEWRVFDQLFRKDFSYSLMVFFAGAFSVLSVHYWVSNTSYYGRVLPFWPFVGLLVFILFYHICSVLSSHLRSFKREPLAWVSLVGALLILPGAIYTAKHFSVNEVVLVMVSVEALIVFPLSFLLWRKYNKNWRLTSGES